jgi:hypothetical protein
MSNYRITLEYVQKSLEFRISHVTMERQEYKILNNTAGLMPLQTPTRAHILPSDFAPAS